MQFHQSDDFNRTQDLRVLHTGPTLSRDESRRIFREMVRAEARGGRFSTTRRKRLIQYAAALQLTPLDASRIVTEVCFELGMPDPLNPPLLYRAVEAAAKPHTWPPWTHAVGAVLGAFIAYQLLIRL